MCEPYTKNAMKPEDELSLLVAKELAVYPNSQALRLFVRAHWRTIARLAHAIHDEGRPTPETGTTSPTANTVDAYIDYKNKYGRYD